MSTLRRSQLISEIVIYASGYRICDVNIQHVERWLGQFSLSDSDEITLLAELTHVLSKTYISEAAMQNFVEEMVFSLPEQFGVTPATFWRETGVIHSQSTGESQTEILDELDRQLLGQFGQAANRQSSSSNKWLYLDDALFTGDQLVANLAAWIAKVNPNPCELVVAMIGSHTYGRYWVETNSKLSRLRAAHGVTLTWRQQMSFENRRYHIAQSSVLWPCAPSTGINLTPITSDAPFGAVWRPTRADAVWPFKSEQARRLIETVFWKHGADLIRLCEAPYDRMKPLGYSGFRGFGFGSMLVSYRRTANNCPLVLWWGGKDKPYPLSEWYPLFPRYPAGSEPRRSNRGSVINGFDDVPF